MHNKDTIMRTKLLLAALISASLTGCVVVVGDSADYVKGNGNNATESRSIASASSCCSGSGTSASM